MNIRLCLVLTFALSGLAWATVNAQQLSQGAGSTGAPGAASPYAQQHSQGYTSFDNPYAPGGIYDPYRNSTLSSTRKGGTQKKSGTSMLRSMQTAKMGDKKNIFGGGSGNSSDNSSGGSSDGSSGGGPDGSSSSSGSNSYSDSDRYSYSSRLSSNQLGGNILGIKTQCNGNRSGGSNGGGSAAGSGMSHQDSANPYSGFSQCGSSPGYGSASSNGTALSGGAKGHMGMNSQSHGHSDGMGQQQSQQQR